MKRFNLISILILFISFVGVQSVVADETNGDGASQDGKYATKAYINGEYKVHSGLGDGLPYEPNPLTIKFDYPTNKITYKAWLSDDVTKSHKVILTAGEQNQETELNNDSDTDGLGKDKNDDYTEHKSLDVTNKTIRSIIFTATQNGNKRIFIGDIYVYMAPHILLEDNDNYTFPNAIEIGLTDKYLVDFKSFLSSSNGTIIVSSSNPTDFKIEHNGQLKDVAEIVGSNVFCSTDDDTKNVNIVFTPQSNKTTSSIITIKDTGSEETKQFTVTGTGKKKTPTFTWTSNTQIVVGESLNLSDVVQSNCGSTIEITSSNETIIKKEDGKLIAVGNGTVTITATTEGNDKYETKTETKTFEATTKTLQDIVWEQDFYLLKLGDNYITLNAYTIDKETKTPNDNLIEYSIAEGGENVVTITNGELHIVGKGQTMITAHQRGNDEYASIYITKPVVVREVSNDCSNNYALTITTKEEEGGLGDGFNYSTLSVTHKLSTIGDKLSFSTSCAGGATGRSVKVKDQNGKEIYNSGDFGSVSNIPINRDVTQLTFEVRSNFNHSISNILVTPAIYLESKQQNGVDFGTIPVNSSTEKTITIDWANQPDMMWATTDNEHFTVESNSNFGGTCGDYGSTEIKVKFTPTTGGNYNGNLLIDVGNDGNTDLTIPLTAKATKIDHTLKWNDGIDNEIELNSIFNCNGKAIIVDNDYKHTIKYDYDAEYFTGLNEYPGYLYAIKEGTTTITAYIEDTETCTRQEATFEVTILPEKATMTWEQDLSNFVEAKSAQTVTLNATSNKEGEIVYEIVSNDDNIISLNGDQLTIAANVTGSAEIKAYNQNYPDVFVIKNVIVASVAPCQTEVDHNINIETDNSIIGQDKEAICTLTLDKKCKSVSFTTDLTGDGMNGESYGIVVVSDNVRGEILNKTFWDNGLQNETCDIDPEATQVTIKITAISVTGSVTPVTAILKDVKTVLVSDFNNYTTDKERFDFGKFSVGASSVSDNLVINHWSLPGSINLSIESGNATRAASPFSVTPTTLSENCGIGEKTVTVTLNPNMGGTFEDYLVIKTGGDKVVRKIPLTAIINKADQTITWTDKSLTTADRQVSIATASSNLAMNYEIVSGGEFARVENNVLGLAAISVVDAGTFKVKAYSEGNESYNAVESEKEFTSTIGTIVFDNNKGDNNWNDAENWLPVSDLNKSRNVAPSAVVNAEIRAEAVISSNANNTRNEIHNILFAEGGKLTIGAGYGLEANSVEGATAENLTLESSADGNAAFTFLSGTRTPSATVKMYSKANQENKPQWQYMGVAVNGATTNDFDGAWLLKWTESENTTGDPWSDAPLVNTPLDAWAGYSISQPQPATYTMSGSLMNDDKTYTLTRTTRDEDTQDPDCGFNLLANSYTAPIDITQLEFSETVDACIVLYNTGTYADWESQQGKLSKENLNNPGQLIVIPKETSSVIGLPTTIASMQAFFVIAKADGATLKVDYKTAVAGATNHGNQMRAPEAHDEFNVLKIMIEGENSRDRLWILENEETTRAYDNGYEARKIFDAPRGHQMYATCQYGYASIDCSESMVGQTIGLKGDNEGELLTITFDTSKLKYYQSLYLYDKATGKYVNITAGEEYTFYGVKGADDNRFSIVTNPDDKMQTPPFVVIDNTLCFDKSQIDTDNANIYIYDTSGRLLMTERVNPYESYNIPDMPNGIYLVSMNGYTTKIVKK